MKKTAITCLLTLSMIGGISTAAVAAPAKVDSTASVKTEQSAFDNAQKNLEAAQTNLEQISNQISILMGQINDNNVQITSNEKQLKIFTAEYQKDLQMEATRIKSIYQNDNNTGFLSVMLTSKNLGQFISKFYAINKLMHLDSQAVQKTQAAKNSMETTSHTLIDLKASNEAKLKDLNSKKAAGQALVTKMKANKAYQAQKLAQAKTAAQASIELLAKAQTISEVNNAVTALKHISTTTDDSGVQSAINTAISTSDAKIAAIKAKPATVVTPKSALVVVPAPVVTPKSASVLVPTPVVTPAKPTEKTTPNNDTSKVVEPSHKTAPAPKPAPQPKPAPVVHSSNSAQAVIAYAETFLGKPYVWGAKGPNAFDCSGLTGYVYNHLGHNIGYSTYTQIDQGTPVSTSNLQAGDLIFWGNPAAPYHVAIYIGGGTYIQAPKPGSNVDISSWNIGNISAARRIL